MALEQGTKSLPFAEGPDTKTDPKLSAKPARMDNCVFRDGTQEKRYGRSVIPADIAGGGTQSAGEALFAREGELVRINGGTAYGFAEDQDNWVAKLGGNNYCAVAKTQLLRSSGTIGAFDHVIVNGIGVIAWFGGYTAATTGLHVSVYDVESGTFYQTGTTQLVGGGSESPRCVVLGTRVVVLVMNGTDLQSTSVNTDAPSTAPAALATIRTDVLATASTFDAFAYNNVQGVCVYPSTGGASLTFIAFDNTGAALASPAPVAVAALTGANGFAAAGVHANRDTAGNVFAVFGDTQAFRTRFIVRSSTFGAVLAVTDIVTTTNWDGNSVSNMLNAASIELTANQLTVVMTNGSSVGTSIVPCWLGKVVIDSAGVVTTFADMPATQGLVVATDFVAYDGGYVFGAINADAFDGITGSSITGIQSTAFVLTSSGTVLAQALMSQVGVSSLATAQRVARATVSGLTASFPFAEQGRFTLAQGGQNITPRGVSRIDVTKTNARDLPITQIGETTYIGGGLPRAYDGQQLVETGFALYPTVTGIAVAGAAGSLSTGTYQYKFVWSWTNAQGELVRGIASPPADIAATATNTATIKIETLPLSTRDLLPSGAQVIIEMYRTIANGTVFFLVTAVAAPTVNQTAYASVTADRTITFTDGASDASIQAGELLYAQGGVLDWEEPPAYLASCAHRNRLIVLPSEDRFSWMPSSEWSPGEQVRFSTVTTGYVPSATGPLTGCASMDGRLVLFTATAAYSVLGDGPDLLGQGGYGPPERIVSVEEGPVSPNSIIVTPLGIMYQGRSGMMLLDRNLNSSLMGADVQQYSTGAYTVRSALVDSTNQLVRFLADPGNDLVGQQTGQLIPSNGGVSLVYDYFYQQWSVFPGYGGQSACMYQGKYAMVRSDGVCWQEQPGTFRDDGDYYSSVLETPWIKLAGIQGFQRIYYVIFLGTYASDFTATLEVAYDYDSSSPRVPIFTETVSLDGEGIYALEGTYQFRHHLGRKCEAVKFRITDSNLRGTGAGMALSDLTLEYGLKRGVLRLAAAKTV